MDRWWVPGKILVICAWVITALAVNTHAGRFNTQFCGLLAVVLTVLHWVFSARPKPAEAPEPGNTFKNMYEGEYSPDPRERLIQFQQGVLTLQDQLSTLQGMQWDDAAKRLEKLLERRNDLASKMQVDPEPSKVMPLA